MTKQNHWISSYGCVYNVNYHFVWSTKYRRKVLVGDVAERLKELNKSISVDKRFEIVVQEVQPDHVPLFIRAHPKFAPSTITKVLKGITAKKLFEEFPELRSKLWKGHLWNPSYYIGTCGDCSKDVVIKYIQTQKER